MKTTLLTTKEVKGLVKMLDEKYNPEYKEANFLGRALLLFPRYSSHLQAAAQLLIPVPYPLDRRMTAGETWGELLRRDSCSSCS